MITPKTRSYRIECENTVTGKREDMGFAPCTHKEACTLLGKITPYKWRRLYLVEVPNG